MAWCTENNIGHYAEASAKDATGVNVAFEQVASLVVAKLNQNMYVDQTWWRICRNRVCQSW
jgi:hypothetical protein